MWSRPLRGLGWLCESLCVVGLVECGQCGQGQSMSVSVGCVDVWCRMTVGRVSVACVSVWCVGLWTVAEFHVGLCVWCVHV